MSLPDALIFDLDGTLWDSCPACAIGWNRAIATLGVDFRQILAEDIRSVCGKPHDVCVREVFAGLPEATIAELITETLTEENSAISRLGGTLYPGVAEGLAELRKSTRLFIVSNCMPEYLDLFLRLSGLGQYFTDVECWGNTRKDKAHNLALLIRRNRLKSPVYIGDTEGDRAASEKCDVPFAFVEYGFGKVSSAHARFSSFTELATHYNPFRQPIPN